MEMMGHDSDTLTNLSKKLSPPLVTLLSSEPEVVTLIYLTPDCAVTRSAAALCRIDDGFESRVMAKGVVNGTDCCHFRCMIKIVRVGGMLRPLKKGLELFHAQLGLPYNSRA